MKAIKSFGIILLALVITACAGGDCIEEVEPVTVVSTTADTVTQTPAPSPVVEPATDTPVAAVPTVPEPPVLIACPQGAFTSPCAPSPVQLPVRIPVVTTPTPPCVTNCNNTFGVVTY